MSQPARWLFGLPSALLLFLSQKRWRGLSQVCYCLILVGTGACTSDPARNDAPAEISSDPALVAAPPVPPAVPVPPSSPSPSASPATPTSASCPIIAERQTRVYFTSSDEAYAELLSALQSRPGSGKALLCFPNETEARESGFRSAKKVGAEDSGSKSGLEIEAPRSATQETVVMKLRCTGGRSVRGEIDRWSPVSKCPEGYQVTGVQRLDLVGDHNVPTNHVNDLSCSDEGCKAWCIGAPCTVEARCCRIDSAEKIY